MEDFILEGEYSKIREWLNEKVHVHGRKYLADDIIKDVCGEGLNSDVFLEYLRKKYSEIYEF